MTAPTSAATTTTGLSPRAWGALVGAGATAVLVLALALGGGAPQPVPAGLPDAGLLTGWSLELARFLSRVAAVGAVGCLLVAAVLAPSDGRTLSGPARRGLRTGGSLSLLWAAAAGAEYVLHVADVTGTGLLHVGLQPLLDRLVTTPEGITTLLVVTIALHVGAQAHAARTPLTAVVLLAAALAAVVPPVAVGHVQSSPDPGLAASSMALHVLTAVVWIGGLGGLVLLLRTEPSALAVGARRFSAVALLCYTGLVLSGVLASLDRVTSPAQLVTTAYGVLLLLKAVLAVVLGVVGGRHRSRTVQALGSHSSHGRPFLRLAVGELVVMAVALALAVALASTPPPGGPSDLWRPDALVAFGALVAATAYALGTTVLDDGKSWRGWRTASFAAGTLVAGVALSTSRGSAVGALVQQLVLVAGPGEPVGLREALAAAHPLSRVGAGWWALLLLAPCLATVGTGVRAPHHLHLAMCLGSVVGGALLACALRASAPTARTLLLLAPCAGLLLVSALLQASSEEGADAAAALGLTTALFAVAAVLLRAAWRRGAEFGPGPTEVLVHRV